MFLFYDSETTGLPKNWKAPMSKLDNWPRVLQLGWQIYDFEGELLNEQSHLIKPDGWIVPEGEFWKKHGYSTEKCEKEGVELPWVLDLFLKDYAEATLLIAHNQNYDYNVIGSEMIRYKKRAESRIARFCTMMSTIKYVQAPGKYGAKFPTLSELHTKLFGVDFDGAHDALSDVKACAKCFFELLKRELIKPDFDAK